MMQNRPLPTQLCGKQEMATTSGFTILLESKAMEKWKKY